MNTRILLLAISVAALSSCSVYKSGQTPDDVYYSSTPARVQKQQQTQGDGDYLDVNQQKAGTNYQTYDQYQDGVRDDRFLRMSVDNPDYMYAYNSYSAFDWRYNSYYDGFNYGYGSPWNNYFAWNNFYNPYYSGFGLSFSSYGYYGSGFYSGGGSIKSVASATPISRPVSFNVNSYSNTNRPAGRPYLNGSYNNSNARYNNSNGNNGRTNSYYNNNNNNGRSSYTPSNSNSNNSSSAPSRSYAPASSGSSSSGGGGGGSISRPGRN
jgi:hypothetical protein